MSAVYWWIWAVLSASNVVLWLTTKAQLKSVFRLLEQARERVALARRLASESEWKTEVVRAIERAASQLDDYDKYPSADLGGMNAGGLVRLELQNLLGISIDEYAEIAGIR